ncbi:mannan-binding protein [Lactococcus petauri]|uniref:mannan-binding protein n=1 Tax=Lactococcus petauri TaxID=1940789 RepID=UPI000A3B76E3|nr:mannan-binding protein [Lactococcus petauri]USI66638.1 hypothetical protein LMK05_05015 [Lactococcus petauri]
METTTTHSHVEQQKIVTGIFANKGDIIDSFTLIYGEEKVRHGGSGGTSSRTFNFAPEEVIVSVEVTEGDYGKEGPAKGHYKECVSRLRFKTNLNNVIEYTSRNFEENQFKKLNIKELKAPEGEYIVSFTSELTPKSWGSFLSFNLSIKETQKIPSTTKYAIDIPAGPIWNQKDAELKGPIIAAAHLGRWTGHWKTVIPGKMSVVNIEFDINKTGKNTIVVDVVAGPIWNEEDAKVKAPIVCASYGGEWTGAWHTPKETWGKMSVCQCKFTF